MCLAPARIVSSSADGVFEENDSKLARIIKQQLKPGSQGQAELNAIYVERCDDSCHQLWLTNAQWVNGSTPLAYLAAHPKRTDRKGIHVCCVLYMHMYNSFI